jgi:hypothetical protein
VSTSPLGDNPTLRAKEAVDDEAWFRGLTTETFG